MRPDGTGVVRVTPEDGVYGSFTFSADRSRIAYTRETPTEPAELYSAVLATPSIPPRPAQAVALTSHNHEMARYAVGRTEADERHCARRSRDTGVLDNH